MNHKRRSRLKKLKATHGWDKQGQLWRKKGKLVITSDQIKKKILKKHYNHPIARHPSVASTYFSIRTYYWWLNIKEWVQQYIKSCGTCQQNKANT
jgi:hypothetical protein